MRKQIGWVVLPMGLLVPRAFADTETAFFVGNSLTYHATVGDQIKTYAADRGIDLSWGSHILCGSGLTQIFSDPFDTCVPPSNYGYFEQALPGYHWDKVSLQPYGDELHTGESVAALMMDMTRNRPDN